MPAPLSPEQLGEASRRLDKLTQSLEDSILEDICRRIAKAGTVTDTAEYQLMRLKEMGYANSFIEKSIADYMEKSEDEIRRLFFEAAQVSSDFYEKYYLQNGKAAIPLEENEYMQQLISAGIEQTKGELKNFTQSMGFAVKQPDGSLKFQPIAKAYQSCLDLAHSQVATGVFDYNTAIRNATAGLTAKGLQFVDYASGHRNRADVAVRRAVLTGIGQMAAKAAEKAMDDLDTEYVEVTAHAGARPDHAKWQGKVYHWNRKNNAASDTTKPLDNGGESGIINTGAISGALNPYSKEAAKHAAQYYESVRHMKTDTSKISAVTGISQDKIDKIKNHVFIDEHDLLTGRERFAPSYDMAQSWQRLINGDYKEQDIVLLKHEYAELRYMEKGYSQSEAHILASKKYNYAKYCE
ncbi:MAG: phage minor capsid protein [Huintestinicola sp.]